MVNRKKCTQFIHTSNLSIHFCKEHNLFSFNTISKSSLILSGRLFEFN